MGDVERPDADATRRLMGLQMMERLAEALEDRFEAQVRAACLSGLALPAERLHDYLTGVADGHEPRVRLLFELYESGALDLSGALADVPQTCFFLGAAARYHVPLRSWLDIFGAPQTFEPVRSDPPVLELWSAGDLTWSRSRESAEDAAAFLTVLLDRPVALWHARVPIGRLRIVAADEWSGRSAGRVVVPPGLVEAEQMTPGETLPTDRPLLPRPRIVTDP